MPVSCVFKSTSLMDNFSSECSVTYLPTYTLYTATAAVSAKQEGVESFRMTRDRSVYLVYTISSDCH